MKSVGMLLSAVCLWLLLSAASMAAPRPNIILIMSDDMGFSDIGCYGSEINTPNLDKLASKGLRFTQFYNTSRCCPSRASLLTGLYAHQAGIGHMTQSHQLEGYEGDLNNHCITIAQALRPAGYATFATGKWHVTKFTRPGSSNLNWPIQRGFDHYYGTLTGAGSFYDPFGLVNDNTHISPYADPDYKPQQYYYTDAISDHACRYIAQHFQQNPQQPMFMYVAYTAAHWPMQALEKDIAKYKGKYDGGYEPTRLARFERLKQMGLIDPKWDLTPQEGDWSKVQNKAWEARCMEVYAAMIDNMDQGIGRIVETLKQTGHYDDTLLLFLQDNGGNLEEVGRKGNTPRADHPTLPPMDPSEIQTTQVPRQSRDGWPVIQGQGLMPGGPDTFVAYGKSWGNVSNTPFREYKHFVHEGGISTPLIAHWPAGIHRAGQLEPQPGHIIDLMATCLYLSGAQYPKEFNGQTLYPVEGRSLAPAFEGKPIAREEPIFWEHEGNRAMRLGKWKLVAKFPAGRWELYDMDADRTEMHDLAKELPDRLNEMKGRWEAWAKRTKALPWPWTPPYGQTVNTAMTFTLKQGDELPSNAAPQFVGRPIHIAATISEPAGDGVIVAQGGSVVGFSLYVKGGQICFCVREEREPTIIRADLPAGPFQVVADLGPKGEMKLAINDKEVASGTARGLLEHMPVDGLQVGRDKAGAVGDYKSPFAYKGKIEQVKIDLGKGEQ
jgi:arylsulfatase A-like enzyme